MINDWVEVSFFWGLTEGPPAPLAADSVFQAEGTASMQQVSADPVGYLSSEHACSSRSGSFLLNLFNVVLFETRLEATPRTAAAQASTDKTSSIHRSYEGTLWTTMTFEAAESLLLPRMLRRRWQRPVLPWRLPKASSIKVLLRANRDKLKQQQ